MDLGELGSGYIPVLLEAPKDSALADVANALLVGQRPIEVISFSKYALGRSSTQLIIDPHFGAAPIAGGARTIGISPPDLAPDNSARFILRAFLKLDSLADVPETIDGELVHSDPQIGPYLVDSVDNSSRAVGNTADVRKNLGTKTLIDNGLDGSGVAIAIVDTGIYFPRLAKRLRGDQLEDPSLDYGNIDDKLDTENSWTPPSIITPPGLHRLGHGTMCAYDALIAAPKAKLLDIAMLIARPPADHTVKATVSAAMQAYWPLISNWVIGPVVRGQQPKYEALIVNNSWGILHPSLDFPPGHPGRFIDNPNHIFRLFVRALTYAGADIIFAGSNCGPECPSAVCLGQSDRMIMGANAYDEVLTLAGCDIKDQRVGYSSRGPSIAGMSPQKPDLTAYTHFLGAKNRRNFLPDSGTSAACAVAAGCVAALRTRASRKGIPPADLFQALKDSALKVAGPNWDSGYGHGIVRPVAAARMLGLIP